MARGMHTLAAICTPEEEELAQKEAAVNALALLVRDHAKALPNFVQDLNSILGMANSELRSLRSRVEARKH